MASSSYNAQLLRCYAYGWINGSGASMVSAGCSLTRAALGTYQLSLDANSGVSDSEGYLTATPKFPAGAGSPLPRFVTVDDTTNVLKTVRVWNASGAAVDSDLELIMWDTTIQNA